MLLIGVFLTGYAAPYLSPRYFWWTDLFAVFVPGLGMVVALLSVWFCVQGYLESNWRRIALGGLLCVLLVVRFGDGLAAWGPSVAEASALRVMTFNVPPTFVRDAPQAASLRALVRQESPHVLALQESKITVSKDGETTGPRTSSAIRAVLKEPGAYSLPQWHSAPSLISQPVVGRVVLDSISVHSLPPDGQKNARARYTRTTFTWQGRPAVLYNVHLHTVGSRRPWTMVPAEWTMPRRWMQFLRAYRNGALRRAQQARLIRRRIEREERPVIVVGDFNSTPHQWAYRHIAKGLQSAVNRRVRGWGGTFPTRYPLVQIDHIVADPAWQVTMARIPPSGSPKVSDHRPVVAHLRWKGP